MASCDSHLSIINRRIVLLTSGAWIFKKIIYIYRTKRIASIIPCIVCVYKMRIVIVI